MKTFGRWLALLIVGSAVLSAMLSVVQWLAAPEGHGASAYARALSETGSPRAGAALGAVAGAGVLRAASSVWEGVISAPRNELLHAFGFLASRDTRNFYAAPHSPITFDRRAAAVFTFGNVLVYLPLVIGLALLRASGWRAIRQPVLIAAVLFVIGAVPCALMAENPAAKILAAASLLTLAVALMWTPMLAPRGRMIAFAIAAIAVSTVGMLAVTSGTGPDDALSYPIFFVRTLATLIVIGGGFLFLVALTRRVLAVLPE